MNNQSLINYVLLPTLITYHCSVWFGSAAEAITPDVSLFNVGNEAVSTFRNTLTEFREDGKHSIWW